MFQIKNEAEKAVVYLYGTIGQDFWSDDDSNTAKSFASTLDSFGEKPLEIRLDSCGGDVYEGFGIASAIQRYKGQTTVYVDGIAASAASYIAVMADKVVMSSFASIMIHNASTYAFGNAEDFRDAVNRLEALDQTIAGIIAGRSGMELDDVKAAMDAETWYTAEQAVANGLADEIIETKQRTSNCLDEAMMARFKHPPKLDKSHAVTTIPEDQGRIRLFGNKVYRVKEQ